MGRPTEYHVIDQRYDQQRNEYCTVGVETMYAIRTTDSNLLVNRMWKMKNRKNNNKQTVLWTVYHTILAVELAIIIAIELTELLQNIA